MYEPHPLALFHLALFCGCVVCLARSLCFHSTLCCGYVVRFSVPHSLALFSLYSMLWLCGVPHSLALLSLHSVLWLCGVPLSLALLSLHSVRCATLCAPLTRVSLHTVALSLAPF